MSDDPKMSAVLDDKRARRRKGWHTSGNCVNYKKMSAIVEAFWKETAALGDADRAEDTRKVIPR